MGYFVEYCQKQQLKEFEQFCIQNNIDLGPIVKVVESVCSRDDLYGDEIYNELMQGIGNIAGGLAGATVGGLQNLGTGLRQGWQFGQNATRGGVPAIGAQTSGQNNTASTTPQTAGQNAPAANNATKPTGQDQIGPQVQQIGSQVQQMNQALKGHGDILNQLMNQIKTMNTAKPAPIPATAPSGNSPGTYAVQ